LPHTPTPSPRDIRAAKTLSAGILSSHACHQDPPSPPPRWLHSAHVHAARRSLVHTPQFSHSCPPFFPRHACARRTAAHAGRDNFATDPFDTFPYANCYAFARPPEDSRCALAVRPSEGTVPPLLAPRVCPQLPSLIHPCVGSRMPALLLACAHFWLPPLLQPRVRPRMSHLLHPQALLTILTQIEWNFMGI